MDWRRKHSNVVMFLGPDGAGKSTIIQELVGRMQRSGRQTVVYHFRPRRRRRAPVTAPYVRAAHSAVFSLGKLTWWLVEYALWGVSRLSARRRRAVAIFDRSILDVAFDPRRYRVPSWFGSLDLIKWLWPRPEAIFVMIVPAEILQSRKKEVTLDEARAQVAAYASPRWQERVVYLDGSDPPEVLVVRVLEHLGQE